MTGVPLFVGLLCKLSYSIAEKGENENQLFYLHKNFFKFPIFYDFPVKTLDFTYVFW
jgi:hypothetical protein